jgi:hypothetical protein
VAGRYAAWQIGQSIVVWDWQLNREAYRVQDPSSDTDPFRRLSLDVQADGKVAFTYLTRAGTRIAWASPQEPFPHTLPAAGR